jgi:quercetin dioxygenase-like cupin family protein
MSTSPRVLAPIIALLLVLASAAAPVAAQESAAPEVGITRTDLGITEPGSAPGQELGLWRYLIPAGSELARHTHPGWQIASIQSGELEYTVVSGEGMLLHADGTSEPIGPGTYTLMTGDGVVENPDEVHFGANRTDADVIILAATLYPVGAPLSIPHD